MKDINSFYSSILNINNKNQKETIQKIVQEEKQLIKDKTNSLEGFCIFIASQIEERLKQEGITVYRIDLNQLIGFNHLSLIAEYKFNDEIIRVLIDPTFEQFKRKEGETLFKLETWPSEKLTNKALVLELLTNGLSTIDNKSFNAYVNAFTSIDQNIDLDEYLLSLKMNKKR